MKNVGMSPKEIAEHNADIVARLQASQAFVQSGLTAKPAEKAAADKAEAKAAKK